MMFSITSCERHYTDVYAEHGIRYIGPYGKAEEQETDDE